MPDNRIKSFRQGHCALIKSVDQIQLYLRSYLQAKPHLRDLHEKLLLHLSRQDEKMYNELFRFYENDHEAIKMLEFLIHDLKDLKVKYLTFYDKHSGELGDINARNFSRDFQDFADEVISRIKIEEDYLFPLLEKAAV